MNPKIELTIQQKEIIEVLKKFKFEVWDLDTNTPYANYYSNNDSIRIYVDTELTWEGLFDEITNFYFEAGKQSRSNEIKEMLGINSFIKEY